MGRLTNPILIIPDRYSEPHRFDNTPYSFRSINSKELLHFANLHSLLFQLQVCKYTGWYRDYAYISVFSAKRIYKKSITYLKKMRRKKKRAEQRKIYESLPYYKRSLSRDIK